MKMGVGMINMEAETLLFTRKAIEKALHHKSNLFSKINGMLYTMRPTKFKNIPTSELLDGMTDLEFITWINTYIKTICDCLDTVSITYNTAHPQGQIFYDIPYDMLVKIITGFNSFLSYCHLELVEYSRFNSLPISGPIRKLFYISFEQNHLTIQLNSETVVQKKKYRPPEEPKIKERFLW